MAYIDESCKVPVVPMVKYLGLDETERLQQRELFCSGVVRNPQFSYPELDGEKLRVTLMKLGKIEVPSELPQAVRELVADKIDHTRTVTQMLIATADGRYDEHLVLSGEAYGTPDEATFWGIVKRQSVPGLKLPSDVVTTHPPGDNVVSFVSRQVYQQYQPVLDMITDESYDAAGIEAALNQVVSLYPVLVEDGWKAEINPSKGSLTIINDTQTIAVPPDRYMDRLELACRAVHEVLTHALRRSNGKRSSLKMLQLGFPEYIEGEDGLALFREGGLRGNVEEFDRWDYYLSVGLALGLDGTSRDFRDVYDIMAALYGQTMPAEQAAEKAFERCYRVFRGTDGQQTGTCNTKDIGYYTGCQRMWSWLPFNQDEWRRLDVGKYDPTNELHRACLDALGL